MSAPVGGVAQSIVVTAPGAGGVVVSACDDFATRELNNPWDMNDPADIVQLIPGVDYEGFSTTGFSNGEFFGVASAGNPFFHLLSPPIPSSQPALGQRGFDHPIDSSVYNTLTMRLFSSSDDGSQEFRLVWNHGAGYFPNYSVSAIQQFTLKKGWNTYTIDLNAVVLQNEGTPRPWASEAVTGLRISFKVPVGATIKADWISLYGSAGCANQGVSVQANPTNDARFYNVYLDTDNDPLNGIIKKITGTPRTASGTQNFTVNSAGLTPGTYVTSALGSSDYATLYRTDPWDMSESTDILAAGDVSNGRIEAGSFRGTTSGSAALVYLKLGTEGIPAASFSRLSFKLERAVSSSFSIFWSGGGSRVVVPATDDPNGDGVYQINLASIPQWSGTISQIMISPSSQVGVDFALDFVTLETVSFRTAVPSPVVATAAGGLRVNAPPLVSIRQPDDVGGEGRYAWNMGRTADIPLVENLSTAEILPFNLVESSIGDFFHGVNPTNEDDPINWSRFFTRGAADIDTSTFYRLSYRLLVEGAVDLVLGSVARVYWTSDRLKTFGQSQDIVVYGGWNTYTVDLRSILLEDGSATWNGVVDSFRVDSHEFMESRPYYFDFIHLRADDRARENFYISYEVSDADDPDTDLLIDLGYSSEKGCASPTPITNFLVSSRAVEKGGYLWNTSGVPAGSYFVCMTVSDGLNLNRRVSTGVVTITSAFSDAEIPEMAIVAPTTGAIFDDILQVKGYALDRVQLAEVRFLIDGALFGVFYPSKFDPAARTAYPDYVDSSNAGFNMLVDTSSLAVGAHTVDIRATDTAGNTRVRSFTVTKVEGATVSIVPDEAPNGSPLSLLSAANNPKVPTISKLTSDKSGTLTLTVKRLTEGCTLGLYVSSRQSSLGMKVAERTVRVSDISRGLKFRSKKLPKSVGDFYIRAVTGCGATVAKTSTRKRFRTLGPSRKKTSASRILRLIKKNGTFL